MAKVPLPPRRPADLSDDKETSSPDTGDNFYPDSEIPVDPDYAKRLEEGYKTPKKRYYPLKKAKGGKVSAREMSDYEKRMGEADTSYIEEDGEADPEATGRMKGNNFLDQMAEKYPLNGKKSVRTRAYSERAKDFGEEGQVGKKRGGMVKKKAGGGMVRGAGCASKGHGKGTMY